MISSSHIKEIDTILTSMDKMRAALKESLQIQDYVKALIEITKEENNASFALYDVDLQDFLAGLRRKAEGLIASSGIELVWSIEVLPNPLRWIKSRFPGLF